MSVDRLPPQDADTETACLASALLNREALYKITEILNPDDFYLEKNRIIFEAIIDLEKKNLPIDLATLKQNLTDHGNIQMIGGDPALIDLYRSISTSANAEYYAKRLHELSLRRKLISVSMNSIEKCYDAARETAQLLDEVERDIFNLTEMRITSDIKTIGQVMDETLDNIGNWYETKRIVTGISTGYKDIDEMLTGFHESELIIIAARPGMGKTTLALNILNSMALKDKKPVLFFSLEMPVTQLGIRMLCIEAMIDSQRVRTGHISGDELRKLLQTSERLRKCSIYIDDTPSVNILEMRAKARRIAKREKLGAIFVDYLQLMPGTARMDRHLQIAEISRFLKQLARDLSVPVIALSQLSRAVESRSEQIPTLADLRESGAIEQDADVVMFIYREEKVKKASERQGIADIIIAKQRNGPVGTIPLRFWEKFTKFGDLTKIEAFEESNPNYEYQ